VGSLGEWRACESSKGSQAYERRSVAITAIPSEEWYLISHFSHAAGSILTVFFKASTRPPAPNKPHGCSVVKKPSIPQRPQEVLPSTTTVQTASNISNLSWNPGNYLFQSENIPLLNVITFCARVGRDAFYSIGWSSRERDDGE
jgi:hypothetical protein